MKQQGKVPQYLAGFLDYIDVEDHRTKDNQTYSVAEIILLAVVAIFADCSGWKEIEEFGKIQLKFLRKYLSYSAGTPSDDTLRRFFRYLDGDILSKCLSLWLQESLGVEIKDLTIAIDGKSLCGSRNGSVKAIHTVSAYISQKNITLTQMQVDGKTNEITAVPKLLDLIDIKGAVVTGDAMNCQTEIVKKIRLKDGDYLLAVKGNHSALYNKITDSFAMIDKYPASKDHMGYDQFNSKEKNRGRIETRTSEIIYVDEGFGGTKWQDLSTIVRVKSQVEYKSKITEDERYFIASRKESAEKNLERTRDHWGIKSNHYILDITFGEDACQIKQGNAPFNIGIIRRFVLNIIQEIKPPRLSISLFRKSAGWDQNKLTLFINRLRKV